MPRKKMSITDQNRYKEMIATAADTMRDLRHPDLVPAILPDEWDSIPLEPIPDKVRITLRVDADVAKFFRKLGRGVYQERMNLVLRTFMLARLTEILGKHEELVLVETDDLGTLRMSQERDLLRELAKLRRKRVGIG